MAERRSVIFQRQPRRVKVPRCFLSDQTRGVRDFLQKLPNTSPIMETRNTNRSPEGDDVPWRFGVVNQYGFEVVDSKQLKHQDII